MPPCDKCPTGIATRAVADYPDEFSPREIEHLRRSCLPVLGRWAERPAAFAVCESCDDGGWHLSAPLATSGAEAAELAAPPREKVTS